MATRKWSVLTDPWTRHKCLAACLAAGFASLSYYLTATLNAPVPGERVPNLEVASPADSEALAGVTGADLIRPALSRRPADGDPDAVWGDMTHDLQAAAVGYPGRVAIYLKDLKRGRTWTYQADDLFPSASLIKVPIMIGVFDKIRAGELSMDTSLVLRRRDRAGGSGSLKRYRSGSRFTVARLLANMIDESDNTATRMLIDEVGIPYLQQEFSKLGLVYTEINPEGMSLRSRPVTYENYTTAREMAGLMERIYDGRAVDVVSSARMLQLMKHLKYRSRLAKGLPPGWKIAHKTGMLRGACHDSAIIFAPQGNYILAVMTGRNKDYYAAKRFITRLGRITYKYYGGASDLYARAVVRRPRRSHV